MVLIPGAPNCHVMYPNGLSDHQKKYNNQIGIKTSILYWSMFFTSHYSPSHQIRSLSSTHFMYLTLYRHFILCQVTVFHLNLENSHSFVHIPPLAFPLICAETLVLFFFLPDILNALPVFGCFYRETRKPHSAAPVENHRLQFSRERGFQQLTELS